MSISICLAGATGWAGSELARGIALTVVLMQKFAAMAARLIPQWEIIDYAHDNKIDAPSGTARELTARLAKVRPPEPTVPVDDTVGPRDRTVESW